MPQPLWMILITQWTVFYYADEPKKSFAKTTRKEANRSSYNQDLQIVFKTCCKYSGQPRLKS